MQALWARAQAMKLLPAPVGAGNDDIVMLSNPVAAGQVLHEAPIEIASASIVQIFETGLLAAGELGAGVI